MERTIPRGPNHKNTQQEIQKFMKQEQQLKKQKNNSNKLLIRINKFLKLIQTESCAGHQLIFNNNKLRQTLITLLTNKHSKFSDKTIDFDTYINNFESYLVGNCIKPDEISDELYNSFNEIKTELYKQTDNYANTLSATRDFTVSGPKNPDDQYKTESMMLNTKNLGNDKTISQEKFKEKLKSILILLKMMKKSEKQALINYIRLELKRNQIIRLLFL